MRNWNIFCITGLFFEFSIKNTFLFAKYYVTLASPNLLTLGKTQIYLVILSLNRNFAAELR